MSKYNEQKYSIKSEAWVFGETKEAILKYYQVFKEKLAQYMLSENGLYEHRNVAKAELVAAMYGFYGSIMKGTDNYLKDKLSKSKNEKACLTPNDFAELFFIPAKDLDDLKIKKLAYELEFYHSHFGHGNLSVDTKEYYDIVDQLEEENQI